MSYASYHTIETLYEELSKHPKDSPINMTLQGYINVTFTEDGTCDTKRVTQQEAWNVIDFYDIESTVGTCLSLLEKHVKTNAKSIVCLNTWPIEKTIKNVITFSDSGIIYKNTHLNTRFNLTQIKKEVSELISLIGSEPNDDILYKWLELKLQGTNFIAYVLEDEVYFNTADLIKKYDLLNKEDIEKVFSKHEKYDKVHVCCITKSDLEKFTMKYTKTKFLDFVSKKCS